MWGGAVKSSGGQGLGSAPGLLCWQSSSADLTAAPGLLWQGLGGQSGTDSGVTPPSTAAAATGTLTPLTSLTAVTHLILPLSAFSLLPSLSIPCAQVQDMLKGLIAAAKQLEADLLSSLPGSSSSSPASPQKEPLILSAPAGGLTGLSLSSEPAEAELERLVPLPMPLLGMGMGDLSEGVCFHGECVDEGCGVVAAPRGSMTSAGGGGSRSSTGSSGRASCSSGSHV